MRTEMTEARSIRVHGVVQGVGFRPFVYRLAHEHGLAGWVLNGSDGVEIHVEGASASLEAFVSDLQSETPAAASIAEILVRPAPPTGLTQFSIRESEPGSHPTVRVSPDLP